MQQLQSQKVAPEPSSRKSSQKWSNLKEPFGNVLHKRFPFGVGSVPADVDLALLRPGVEADFLDDKTRTLLKIPVNRKPRMALVDSQVLSDFMYQVGASVDKLDEMLNVYEDVADNTTESGQDRMHQVINSAVQLVSQYKGTCNVPLGAVGKWLHNQHLDFEREEADNSNDDYDFPDLDAELEEIKAAEEAASAKPGEETVLPAYYMDASLRAKDVAHSPEVGVGTPTSPLASALLDTAQRSRLGALKGQSTNEEEGDDGHSPFGAPSPTRGSALPPMWTSDRISPAKKAKASLEPEETSSAVVADKDKEIERLRIAVNQQRLKVIEAQEECVEHRQAEMDAKAQLEAVQAMVAELTNRLEDAGQHVDKLAASSKVVRGQQKPKSGTAGPQSTAACSEADSKLQDPGLASRVQSVEQEGQIRQEERMLEGEETLGTEQNDGEAAEEEDDGLELEDGAMTADTEQAEVGAAAGMARTGGGKVRKVRNSTKSAKAAHAPASGGQGSSKPGANRASATARTGKQAQPKPQKAAGASGPTTAVSGAISTEEAEDSAWDVPQATAKVTRKKKVARKAKLAGGGEELEEEDVKSFEEVAEHAVMESLTGSEAAAAELSMLQRQVETLQAELKARDAMLARFRKDNGEMQEAIQQVVTTLEGDPKQPRSTATAADASTSQARQSHTQGQPSGSAMQERTTQADSIATAQHTCGVLNAASASRRPSKPQVCPRCKQLLEQLRYWRERDWLQQERSNAWAKVLAARAAVSVNVKRKWAGPLVEAQEDGPDGPAKIESTGCRMAKVVEDAVGKDESKAGASAQPDKKASPAQPKVSQLPKVPRKPEALQHPKVSQLAIRADAQSLTSSSSLNLESSKPDVPDTMLEGGASASPRHLFAVGGDLGEKAPGLLVQRYKSMQPTDVSGLGIDTRRSSSPASIKDAQQPPRNRQDAQSHAEPSGLVEERQRRLSAGHKGRLEAHGHSLFRPEPPELKNDRTRRSTHMLDSVIEGLLASRQAQAASVRQARAASVTGSSPESGDLDRGRARSTMVLRHNSHVLDLDKLEVERLRAAPRKSRGGEQPQARRPRSAFDGPSRRRQEDADALAGFIASGHRPGPGARKP